jgi:hypothetical protein
MFDAMSIQDIAVACGFALSFGVGVIAGLLS